MAIIGVDLGTTNSVCAIWDGGGPRLIPNRLGDLLTPSVVGLDDKGVVTVGRVAKERLITHGDRTVAVFKRLMGTGHRMLLGARPFTAVELSSLVLRSLKKDAEVFLGETVTEAVISVPAYFNNLQRAATKLSAEMVGLKVRRLINEPTAAALSFGVHHRKEGTFMILDLGGGTFDVSILEFFDGVMQVHASAGDNFLGGEDFVEVMAEAILQSSATPRSSLSPALLQKLLMQLETAKRRLDVGEQVLDLNLGKKEIQWPVTEEWFSSISAPLLLRARKPIEAALRDAEFELKDIDEVILVGGATRMKAFRSTVGSLLGQVPSHQVDPDLAVAMGAAIQAGLLAKEQALEDHVLTDVCPFTQGTEVVGPDHTTGGYYLPIIERNSVVPISVSRTVSTVRDGQTALEIKVYQGENRMVEKNVYLGSVHIRVPKAPAGQEPVAIRYTYDANGLLEVDVTVQSTGHQESRVIEQMQGVLTEAEKKATREKLAALKFHPRDHEENRAVLAKGARIYESSLGARREEIGTLLAEFDRVLEGQNPVEIKKARYVLKEKLDELDHEDWT